MTYLEYMEQNPEANFSWCKPYTNENETHYVVVYDGCAVSIDTPETAVSSYEDGDNFAEALTSLARDVNPDYDLYSGWDDLHIALERMHETGCWNCPFKDDCESMGEEIGATDNV